MHHHVTKSIILALSDSAALISSSVLCDRPVCLFFVLLNQVTAY